MKPPPGSSLTPRRALLRVLSWLAVAGALGSCAAEHARRAVVTDAPSAPAPSIRDAAGPFLFRTDEGAILLRSPGARSSLVAARMESYLYDDAYELIWFVNDGRLSAFDLRSRAATMPIAEGLPRVSEIWVEWTAAKRFIQQRTGCEPWHVLSLQVGPRPSLRWFGEEDPALPLEEAGRRWLFDQAARSPRATRAEEDFMDSPRVELPASVASCDDPERCGQSIAFGAQGHRLVLVRDRFGADCWHRGCLLYDPATRRFASPPVIDGEGTAALSAPGAPQWTSAEEAPVGVCGPYRFDQNQTHVLVRRYLCRLGAACEEVGGETIGWLEPGRVVGEPG